MKDIMKVARWEIKKILKSKTFIVMTFIVPLVILLLGGVVGYFSSRESDSRTLTVGLVNNTGVMTEEIKESFAARDSKVIVLEEKGEDEYSALIKEEELDGILVIPEDVMGTNKVDFYFTDLRSVERDLLTAILSPVIVNNRLEERGYNPEEIYSLTKNIEINNRALAAAREAGGMGSMFLPLGLAMLMVFASMFSGGTLMQSIIKEKSNRIVELILSSISSGSLMAGKVLGYGVLGIIQVTIWAGSALLVAVYFFDLSIAPLVNVKTLYMLIYFILGFVLSAGINAIVGAGMKEAQSGSQSTGLLIIIPIIPVYFSGAIINNPAGTISRTLSYIPFTTPTAMLIRLGFSSPSGLEILGTIIMLLVFNYLLIRLSAKIFRVGMLMYGKNASFRELWKWARH